MGFTEKPAFTKRTLFFLLFCVVGGLLLTGICILLFAFLMVRLDLNAGLSSVFATLSLAVGSLTAAYFAVRLIGRKGLWVGMGIGAVEFLICLLGAFLFSQRALGFNTLFHLICCLLCGAIGGVWSVNRMQRKKYKIP